MRRQSDLPTLFMMTNIIITVEVARNLLSLVDGVVAANGNGREEEEQEQGRQVDHRSHHTIAIGCYTTTISKWQVSCDCDNNDNVCHHKRVGGHFVFV
jgi:hypothetical protein